MLFCLLTLYTISLVIQDFEAKLRDRSNSGAIFFAVCRGKVSS